MKKIVSLVVVLILVFALGTTAFAAPAGLNSYEQDVLAQLKTGKVLGENGWTFALPTKYVNQAENYFNTVDMTEAQKDVILAKISEAMGIIKAQADGQNFKGETNNLKLMDAAAKQKVLELSQAACEQVNATLVYDAPHDKVIITANGTGTVVFENSPLVKTTGQDFPITATAVISVVAAVVVLGTALMFVLSKKKGLLA